MLKPHYLKVQAVKITKSNYRKLKETDIGDGVLKEGEFEDYEGDWFVLGTNGYEVMSGNIDLVPLKSGKG